MNPSSVVAAKTLPFKRKPVAAMIAQKPKARVDNVLNLNKSNYLTDKHEQQARSYGKRWNSYQDQPEHVDRPSSFIPAQAARYYAPNSIAERLPSTLEERLSEFFNADLSAVRVHRDGPAHLASGVEAAKAFSAGLHVYFSSGMYRPDRSTGQELLVHELTHVLQQTGRSASGGKLRASDVAARGEIQRALNTEQFINLYKANASDGDSATELNTEQSENFTSVDRAIHHVLGLHVLSVENHNLNEDTTARANALEANVIAGAYDAYSAESKSLLFDILKIWGRFEGAAYLINQDQTIETRYYPNDTFLDYLKSDDRYAIRAVRGITIGRGGYFYNITTSLWQDLIQRHRSAVTTPHGIPSSENDVWQVYRERNAIFNNNELSILARDALYRINQLSVSVWNEAVGTTRPEGQSNIERRRYLAQHIAESLDNPRTGEDPHLRHGRRALRGIARGAKDFWTRVLQTKSEVTGIGNSFARSLLLGQQVNIEELLGNIEFASDTVLTRLLNTVVRNVEAIFYSIDDQNGAKTLVVKGAADYGPAITRFVSDLEQFSELISNRLGRVFRFRDRNQTRLANQVLWLGWSQYWVSRIRAFMSRFNQPAADDAQANDKMLLHRLQVAEWLIQLASVSQNQFLLNTVRGVFKADDVGQSYVILAGEWQQDEDAQVEDLRTDFSNKISGLGVPTSKLVTIYQILYGQSFNRNLSTLLRARENTFQGGQQSFVRDALNQTNETPRPTRWINTNALVVYHRQGRRAEPDTPLVTLLNRHPSFTEFMQQRGSAGGKVVVPEGASHRIFAWLLPEFSPIISFIRGISSLDSLVIQLGNLDEGVSDQVWVDEFVELVEQPNQAAVGSNSERILSSLGTGVTSEVTRMNRRQAYLMRRVTTNRRRALVAQHGPLIQDYVDNHYAEYSNPTDALRAIENFVLYIQPRDTDENAQQAALMLGLAPQLKNMFVRDTWLGTVRERRYDLVTGYYNFVELALDESESPEGQAAIRRVLFRPQNLLRSDRDFHIRNGATFENYVTLIANRGHLVAIKKSLDTVILSQQLGFESADGRKLKSLNFAAEFPEGGAGFEIQGRVYRIEEIRSAFRYHPSYGNISAPIINTLDGNPYPEGQLILRYTVDSGEPISIYNRAEDYLYLKRLDEVLGLAAFVATMGALESVINDAAELGLDILEMTPGIGQGVMAARALLAVTVFIVQDLPNIKQELFEEPQQIISDIKDYIDLDIARIIEILLFESFRFEDRLRIPEDDSDTPRRGRSHGRAAKLRRLFDFVGEMGEDALRAFVRLRGSVRRNFVQSQGRIIASPILLRVIDALPLIIRLGSEAVEMAEAFDGINSFDDVERRIQLELENILNGMAEVEIPNEIIPIDLAASIILNFALSKLGRKGKVVARILEVVGAIDKAGTLIKDAIEDTDANPNKYWRDNIKTALQPKLRLIQQELYSDVSSMVAAATENRIQIGQPSFQDATVRSDTSRPENEALDPKVADGDEVNDIRLPRTEFGGGHAFTPQEKMRYLKEFGHHFDHVRLHRDDSAQRLTQAANALALTSGSHIFFNRKVAAGTRSSEKLIRHELSHVLQQGGARPRGARSDDAPIKGKSNRGLEINRAREDAADRMADMAERRQYEEEPLPVYVPGGSGWLPTMQDVAVKLLDELVDDDVADSLADTFEQTTSIPRALRNHTTFSNAVSQARTLWTDILRMVSAGGTSTAYRAPFNHAEDEIKGYFAGGVNERVRGHIIGVVLSSVKTLGNGQMRLKKNTFINNLETYIFARSGLVLNIDLTSSGRVQNIVFRYLHLPNLHGGTHLWTKLTDNTRQAMATAGRPAFTNNDWGRLREFLATRLHDSAVYHRTEFRLSNAIITEAIRFFQNIGNVATKLGNWDDYKNVSPTQSNNMGMRVSTHDDLTNRHSRAGFAGARHSHHVPQYLLVEYFRNNATNNSVPLLFGAPEERLPGFNPTSQTQNLDNFSIDGASGAPTVNFRTLDGNSSSSRGVGLPAVSLAAVTHEKGRLHINAGGSWSENQEETGSSTQGARLDSLFMQRLSRQGLRGTKAQIVSNTLGMGNTELRGVKTKVHGAMKDTYSSMYTMMIEALPRALVNYEIPYYHEVAMLATNKDSIASLASEFRPHQRESEINHVKDAIEAKQEIMSEWR